MKYFISLILVVLSSMSASAQEGVKIEKDLIEVAFNSTMDLEDLESIQRKLLKKGVELKYKETTFYENGNLSSISFKVDFSDGFKGSASRSFLTKKTRFGFRRDYSKKTKTPFKTGNLD